ncbi:MULTISPECIES: hypothetical protein [unclassified Microcoleus]|uniref:hypothetical protein n=1 Tax=unclassified Microcoleus TaxID=2642155 RepID=UPI002FD505BB
MANITNIVFSATKATNTRNSWRLMVQYDCQINDKELKLDFDYEDWFEVLEDDTFNDDKLTGKVGISVFDPSTNLTKRTLAAIIDGDKLNTELGKEELYVKVYLKNDTLDLIYSPKRSGNLSLKP